MSYSSIYSAGGSIFQQGRDQSFAMVHAVGHGFFLQAGSPFLKKNVLVLNRLN
jgi:hypothetical protein